MDIEKVRILKTLKCGEKIWKKGAVIEKPIPASLIVEVRSNSDTVEVLNEPKVEPQPALEVYEEEPKVDEPKVEPQLELEVYEEEPKVDEPETVITTKKESIRKIKR